MKRQIKCTKQEYPLAEYEYSASALMQFTNGFCFKYDRKTGGEEAKEEVSKKVFFEAVEKLDTLLSAKIPTATVRDERYIEYLIELFDALQGGKYYMACDGLFATLNFIQTDSYHANAYSEKWGYRQFNFLDAITLEIITDVIEMGLGRHVFKNKRPLLQELNRNGKLFYRSNAEACRLCWEGERGPNYDFLTFYSPFLGLENTIFDWKRGKYPSIPSEDFIFDFVNNILIREMQMYFGYGLVPDSAPLTSLHDFPIKPRFVENVVLHAGDTHFVVWPHEARSPAIECVKKATGEKEDYCAEYFQELNICIVNRANEKLINALADDDKNFEIPAQMYSIENLYNELSYQRDGNWNNPETNKHYSKNEYAQDKWKNYTLRKIYQMAKVRHYAKEKNIELFDIFEWYI